jgi:hypothetical protein
MIMTEKAELGKIIDGEHKRDAIHIAIVPVCAHQSLSPGDHIGFVNETKISVGLGKNPIGIVDPFLTEKVRKGQWFYMCLYPGTIADFWKNYAIITDADPTDRGSAFSCSC